MKWLLYSLFYFCSIFSAAAQQADTTNITDTINVNHSIEKERYNVELAINVSQYNSLSVSIEKEFQYNKFFFGPRIEILNPFRQLTYTVQANNKDTTYTTDWQWRIRLAQIEYQATDRIRVGIAPFWMLGPQPRRGYYQTPSSLYATFWLDKPKTLQLECLFQSASQAPVQLSVRKTL
jgi:hypothetical protein